MRCTATTGRGTRCERLAAEGAPRCRSHARIASAPQLRALLVGRVHRRDRRREPPTARQLDVLRAVVAARRAEGPELRELGRAIGLTDRAVLCHLESLEAKGLLVLGRRNRPVETDAGLAAIGAKRCSHCGRAA